MLSMTFTFFLVELIVGHISHSIALIADSFHMLSDALALCVGLFTAIISTRSSTKNTYGWVRAEVLGPFINSVFLLSLCLSIIIEAIERLIDPKPLNDIDLLLYVGTLGLIINLIGLFLFGHGHSHGVPHEEIESDEEDDDVSEVMKMIERSSMDAEIELKDKSSVVVNVKTASSKKSGKCCAILSSEANMNMRAVFLHVLADALGSVIVIISALLNKFRAELSVPDKLINYIDPVLCLCLVTLILSSTIPLLKESGLILLQTVPKDIEVSQLKRELVEKVSGISSVHELHIWKLSGRKIIATAHVKCHDTQEYMNVAAKIKTFFHKKGIHSTTIQPEFDMIQSGASQDCLIECLQNANCVEDTCCGTQLVKNKSVASQLKAQS